MPRAARWTLRTSTTQETVTDQGQTIEIEGFDHAGVGAGGFSHGGGLVGGAPLGAHSSAFSRFNHGGITNAYSSRGQASFHGGGGGGFHGGGGGGSHGGGGGHR